MKEKTVLQKLIEYVEDNPDCLTPGEFVAMLEVEFLPLEQQAMDTHAEQVAEKKAVEFAEWVINVGYYKDAVEGIWYEETVNGIDKYTTAELFNLFTTKKEEDADK